MLTNTHQKARAVAPAPTKVTRIRIKWMHDDDTQWEGGTYTDGQARSTQVYVNRATGEVIDTAYTNEGSDEHLASVMEAALDDDESVIEPEPTPIASGFQKQRGHHVYGYYVSDNYALGLGEAFDVDASTWEKAQAGFSRYNITPDLERRERHYWLNLLHFCEEYARAEALNDGAWCYLGCRAIAETDGDVMADDETHVFAESAGTWGIESDGGEAYRQEIAAEQIAELRETLRDCGVECPADVEVVIDD